ncbi:endonuclease VIII [Anaerostipes sp.]|uniref:endonuclease VIII n=1 Tax=Anaerostipes sp. TaxID=1872530 RepID=UPI0025BE6400|nr:endonuclease VIII [Anaerostipes sp.]MBS7008571.1 endonuclease VIII [Anaerostipes sp.]
MIELPEALARADELGKILSGKKALKVYPPSSPHKFCWFNGDAALYNKMLKGKAVMGTEGFGIFAEIKFDGGIRLCINDGVNPRIFRTDDQVPEKYQLRIDFTDGYVLIFTVAMYGAISCFDGNYDNEYYEISRKGISPLSTEFNYPFFRELFDSVKPNSSVKALLATKQRIPGLGNGVLQDILFEAGIHPKRKIGTLPEREKERIFASIKEVLSEMVRLGGRDTEKDIWGNSGGYKTKLSKNTYKKGCPKCGGEIIKATYLGGTVYFCPVCQPLDV